MNCYILLPSIHLLVIALIIAFFMSADRDN